MVNMARTVRDHCVSQQNHELAISTAAAAATTTTTTTTATTTTTTTITTTPTITTTTTITTTITTTTTIATRYSLDSSGTKPRVEEREFLFSTLIQTGLEGPPSLLYNGYQCYFLGVNQLGRGVDQPHNLAPRLRMSTAIPAMTLCACMACYGQIFTFNNETFNT